MLFFTFSQLLNKFYIRKFQNIHLTPPKIKIKTYSELIHDIYVGVGARKSEKLREREIGRERDGDRINKIGLQWRQRSSAVAMRSILGGSGILEGGFK